MRVFPSESLGSPPTARMSSKFDCVANQPPVAAEGDAGDPAVMAAEDDEARHVPDLDRPVLAGRGEPPVAREERHVEDRAAVAEEDSSLFAGRDIPEPDGSVLGRRGDRPCCRG